MAALSGLQQIFVFTHDSIFVGEDGPTHQPTNHLVMLRTIPNLKVFRPANWQETAVAFAQALSWRKGPSAIVLSRQTVGQFEVRAGVTPEDIKRGAYTIFERLHGRSPEVVIAASGSEVALAVETAIALSSRAAVRVVSMPSWDAFRSQGSEYMWELFPEKAVKLCLEAGSTFGWETVVPGVRGENLFVLGVDQFGVSAPAEVLADRFGFTVEGVIALVRSDQA